MDEQTQSSFNHPDLSGAVPVGQSLNRRNLLTIGAALGLGGLMPDGARAGQFAGRIDWTMQRPEAAGLTATGVDGIRAAVQKQIDDNVIGGAVSAVFRHGKLAWYEAQGYSDPTARIPMRRDDVFRTMSSTKPVTAVAILMMMDEGRLSIDDKVSRFIPTFVNPRVAVAAAGTKDPSQVAIVPAKREITIKDLLTHTSGLTSVGDSMTVGGAAHLVNRIEKQADDTLSSYIPRLGPAVLDFHPGSRWHYSPLDGMDTLLRIVEITSGQDADTFMRERIFEPLNMRDTHYNLPPEKTPRLVGIRAYESGTWVPKEDILPRRSNYISGGAGLYSTVRDFMQFELMLLGKGELNGRRLLAPQTVELMATNQVGSKFADWMPPITGGNGFGLGVRISQDPARTGRSVGAFGWPGAYGTDAWVDPELDLAAVLFIQKLPTSFIPGTAFGEAVTKAVA